MNRDFSFPKDKINILLLEGIHPSAVEHFHRCGYTRVTSMAGALEGAELEAAIAEAHIIGIRSRTQLTKSVLARAGKLYAIGCFCIGTNQVDLAAARAAGIPVFNAPHSNTRSVAELVIAEMIMLLRGLYDKVAAAHRGEWIKSAAGCYEVRGKTLGIVGYGHIGSQVSILAEAMGLRVVYHDIESKLAMGNAVQLPELKDVLKAADIVTLHVPEDASTEKLIGERELKMMKTGAVLINASRGRVVDLEALARRLQSKKLLGAALDVFPREPKALDEKFSCPLSGMPNVILTPHIGGSTHEAQVNIGKEVSGLLVQYSDQGVTRGAVNFPQIALPAQDSNHHRLLHVHHNTPGVLGKINQILSNAGANILGQYLQTLPDVGYVVIDIDRGHNQKLTRLLRDIPETIRLRMLY